MHRGRKPGHGVDKDAGGETATMRVTNFAHGAASRCHGSHLVASVCTDAGQLCGWEASEVSDCRVQLKCIKDSIKGTTALCREVRRHIGPWSHHPLMG